MKDRDEKKETKKKRKEEKEELTGMAAVLSENVSDHILCCICNEQTGVYQCRDSVGIHAEYDHERRPGAGKPSGIYKG